MSGPYYTPIPANPVLDTNSAAKSATLAGLPQYCGLQWVTACFATSSDPQYNIVYDQDPAAQPGQPYSWAYQSSSSRATSVEPLRIPAPPDFYPQPGGYADGTAWDGWGCVIDPSRNVGWMGWRMAKVGGNWQATASGAFTAPGDITQVTSGLGRGDGLPAIAGSITTREVADAMSDATDTYVIPHALAVSVDISLVDTAFRAPATKSDGVTTPTNSTISEGSRFYLPSTATTASSNRFFRALLRTLKTYGLYVVDRNGGGAMMLNFERWDPANPDNMIDPNTGQPTTLSNPASISKVYYDAGLQWDYYSLSAIPWSSIRLLRQWNGA